MYCWPDRRCRTSFEGVLNASTQDIHLVTEVDRPGVTCGPGYVGNRVDGISHRVIDKRVCRIGESAAGDIGAATCVDQAADGRRRYIAERNWQDSILLHPASGLGVNCQIWSVPTPLGMSKPPRITSVLLNTLKPPGRMPIPQAASY